MKDYCHPNKIIAKMEEIKKYCYIAQVEID